LRVWSKPLAGGDEIDGGSGDWVCGIAASAAAWTAFLRPKVGHQPMTGRRKANSLDIEAQKIVLAELTELAERSWDLVAALRQAGWDQVVPRINFEKSFGQGDEVLEYRRAVVELAKVGLACPNIRFRLAEGSAYTSPFLRELRLRRNEENNKLFGTDDVPIWAREAVPCLRRMALFRYSQRPEFERRLRDVIADERRRRVHEIASHVSGVSREFQDELEQPARFYRAILEREAKPMGFAYDTARSDIYYVALTTLIDGWDLCLTPEPLVWYPGRGDGHARVLLSLQAAGHRRCPIRKAKWDRVIVIEYAELVRDFDQRYLTFSSLDELEAIIMARAFLLSLSIKEIETRLRAGLCKVL